MRDDKEQGDGAGGAASVTGDAARDLEGNVGVGGAVGGSGAGRTPPPHDQGEPASDLSDGDGAGGAASVTGDAARNVGGSVGVGGDLGGSGSGSLPPSP